MSKFITFTSDQFGQVRTILLNGKPLFCLADVCKSLEYKNPREALRKHVYKDDVTKCDTIDLLGRKQSVSYVNESGLIDLILSSKLPKAREFRRWITTEVIPQIMDTGGYIPVEGKDDENNLLAKALIIAQKTIEAKNELIEKQKSKVQFADAVEGASNSILIRDLAKLITQNGVEIGQNRLFYWLRLKGYLFQNERRPIQKWVEKGLFDTKVTVSDMNGVRFENLTTRVTGKGQQYFLNGFLSGKFKAENCCWR